MPGSEAACRAIATWRGFLMSGCLTITRARDVDSLIAARQRRGFPCLPCGVASFSLSQPGLRFCGAPLCSDGGVLPIGPRRRAVFVS
jgi:hypothetical protein